ncbi:MAG: hypothetical protein HC802_00175 [Caldilineaceae bacterium]|nr:hypothetical protein [Caldilineaceae bacterium]
MALAAQRLTVTAVVISTSGEGTPIPFPTETLLPPNWVTPLIVVNTPVPENAATAVWLSQIATAQAIVHGTPTPLPPNAWTATPLPPSPTVTPTPDLVAFSTLTPTFTPTVTPTDLPPVLRNKIVFKTDRYGANTETLMVMNPDGTDVAIWAAGADDWIFQEAQRKHAYSANGQYKVVVEEDIRSRKFQIFVDDLFYGTKSLVHYMEDMSFDPVISPVEYKVAFVSLASGNDEIYTVNIDGTGLTRLTFNTWEWDKHPTWSPDGSQIAFWSNRDTQLKQIWLMNADGSNPVNISNNTFNDWDPVWVR